jgi:hypothetical protein
VTVKVLRPTVEDHDASEPSAFVSRSSERAYCEFAVVDPLTGAVNTTPVLSALAWKYGLVNEARAGLWTVSGLVPPSSGVGRVRYHVEQFRIWHGRAALVGAVVVVVDCTVVVVAGAVVVVGAAVVVVVDPADDVVVVVLGFGLQYQWTDVWVVHVTCPRGPAQLTTADCVALCTAAYEGCA